MEKELPLVHTSRCEFLSGFVSANQIQPRDCPVFNESLVYLFYGRPAYRSTRGRHAGQSTALCPVCFVFKPRTVSRNLHRLFPLDTGAANSNRFRPHITKDDFKELELDPQIRSARRAVPLLFGTNADYFLGRALTSVPLPGGTTAAKFHELLLQPGRTRYDDRRSAIEASCSTAIPLRNTLAFVVLPQEFLDDPAILRAIKEEWNARPVPYNTVFGTSPTEYYPVVRLKVEDYLQRRRF